MKIFQMLHVMLAQSFYRWAMREISPLHADVPGIMLRQHALGEKYKLMWA